MLELNDLIPDSSESWVIGSTQLIHKRVGLNIPICILEENIAYIFINNSSFHNPVFKLVKHFIKNNIEFYFYPPVYSHPATEINNSLVIYHYLLSYSNEKYYNGFEKMGFDLIENLVKWTYKENCFDLVREQHIEIQKKIQKKGYEPYTNKYEFVYPEYIRDEFNSLYRDIRLNQILI